MGKCIFCKVSLNGFRNSDNLVKCSCPVCGNYDITEEALEDFPQSVFEKDSVKISTYLRYKHINNERVIIFYDCTDALKMRYGICFEEMINQFPRTLSERIEKCLLSLSRLSKYLGDYIGINGHNYPIFFPDSTESRACFFMMEQLFHQGLIENTNLNNKPLFPTSIRLTAQGWERIVELQRSKEIIPKTVFIAMWFNPSMLTPIKRV